MDDVRLELLDTRHAEATFRWVSDPEVAQNLGLRKEPSLPATIDWIKRARNDSATHAFAVLVDGKHVGNVVLDEIDRHLSTCRLSIFIGEVSMRGRGIGRRAVELAAAEAFTSFGLHKVWLIVHAKNTAAIRAYLTAGFVIEGVLRDEFLLGGKRVHMVRMGLLASDFRRAELNLA